MTNKLSAEAALDQIASWLSKGEDEGVDHFDALNAIEDIVRQTGRSI